MKRFFSNKLNYNHDSNQKIIDLIEAHPNCYSSRLQTLVGHTLNAQNIWNHRLLGLPPTQKVWDLFPLEDLTVLNKQNHHKSLEILAHLDLDRVVHYHNSEGISNSKKAEDIIYHIVNHGTYHRGQISTELKKQGVQPLGTDYIFYNG